jgi:hypothetical protein
MTVVVRVPVMIAGRFTGQRRPAFLLALSLGLAAAPVARAADAVPAATLREKVCEHHQPAFPGDQFSLMSLAGPRGANKTGVLLLINCSQRKVVSLRDPSLSPRHVREHLYEPASRARMRRDAHRYEILNFNKEARNSVFQHTAFARDLPWDGLCRYDGLELTTVDPGNSTDRHTIVFSLDICRNQILALVTPPVPGPSGVRPVSLPR